MAFFGRGSVDKVVFGLVEGGVFRAGLLQTDNVCVDVEEFVLNEGRTLEMRIKGEKVRTGNVEHDGRRT